jgi:hypothetical protein
VASLLKRGAPEDAAAAGAGLATAVRPEQYTPRCGGGAGAAVELEEDAAAREGDPMFYGYPSDLDRH